MTMSDVFAIVVAATTLTASLTLLSREGRMRDVEFIAYGLSCALAPVLARFVWDRRGAIRCALFHQQWRYYFGYRGYCRKCGHSFNAH